MILKKTWFVGVVMLSSLGVSASTTVFAQHGPGRHGSGPHIAPAYDTKSEATFEGTVADLNTAGHPMGGQREVKVTQLLLKTDTETLEVQLGPTAFLTEKKVEVRKGDTLEVTGSRVPIGESHVVLAREIRKGDNAWVLRDATGQPLWSSVQTEARGFWTKKKVFLAAVVIKVAALATVLLR